MTITRIALGSVNAYLIRTATGSFLIDSGVAASRKELIAGITAAGEDPGAIRLLILTHGHCDHAGNAAWLQKEYGIPTAIHRLEAAYVKTASNEIPPGTSAIARIIGRLLAVIAPQTSWEAFTPDHLLDSATDLQTFGLDARVVEFSGHTPGSIGLLFPDGELIAGDLISNFRKPGLGFFACDIERMKNDVKSLGAMGVRMIYPGHGKPFEAEQITRSA